MLENLKKKDPPILTTDEIITATEEVERLINFLKEDTSAAKVTILMHHIYNLSNTEYYNILKLNKFNCGNRTDVVLVMLRIILVLIYPQHDSLVFIFIV